MSNDNVILVADFGNGQDKIRCGGTRKVYNSFYRRCDPGKLDLMKLSTGRASGNGSFRINVAGSGYYDINVSAADGFDLRAMGVSRYVDKDRSNIMITAALHKLGATVTRGFDVEEIIPIRLGLCAPTAYIVGIGNEGIDVKAEMSKRFRGRYEIKRGKKTYTAQVRSVAVYGEGLAGYFFHALEDDLKTFKAKWLHKPVLVLDIGRGTINALVVKDGQAARSGILAQMWGVDLLFRKIAEELDNSRQQITPEMVEATILSNGGIMSGQPKFKQVARDAVFDYTGRLQTLVSTMIARSGLPVEDVMLFGGGTSLLSSEDFGRNALDVRLQTKGFKVLLGDQWTNLNGLNKLVGGEEWEDEDEEG
jgi:hypothetical protein